MTGPENEQPLPDTTRWQSAGTPAENAVNDAAAQSAAQNDTSGADDPTTVVSRDRLAAATPPVDQHDAGGYPTSQDYRRAGDDDATEVHGYPVTRDPEIGAGAGTPGAGNAGDTSVIGTSSGGASTGGVPEQPPTQWHEGPNDYRDEPTADRPYDAGPGYQPTPAYSAAPEHSAPQQVGAGPGTGYDGPGGSPDQPAYGSASTGFFSPQAVQSGRVELAPARTRVGQNLLGALVGLIFVAGAAALYAVIFKNVSAEAATGTGHKLALIGLALVVAVPALLAGWAPAAGWFPGIVLVIGVGVALFSDSLARKYAEWSNSLFGTPVAAQFLLEWGMVAGFALLLAGIGAHLARRSAEHGVIDRIVNR